MSAADCPGCGLPVATPADAGSWTPDGTVCWRGGRCEVSAADDADRAIDRLRQIAAAWHRAVHVDSSMIPVHICDLDAVLADVSAERTRAVAAEAARDYWLAQATMAAPCVDAVRALTLRLIPGGTGCTVDPERVVAAVDGLRAECDRIDRLASRQAGEYMEAAHGLATERDAARRAATFAEMERDTLRGLTDAMRADNVRLRGIVAGRETAPTWPLAPVRCAAPEPVALCPVVHRRRDGAHTHLWCRRPHGRALVCYFAWRATQPTCATSRGRCGR